MQAFEAILLILLGAVALLAIARRFDAPYPALLALAGAVLALSPMALPFRLDPQLALALFVAPVLLDAAYDTSVRDLRANWRPVVRMVLVAVGLTTAAVACVAHMLVPSLPWAAAIALGAVVAPPDAAAATTILRSVRLPHRLTVILEGESLLNDASALLIYRLAVGAAMTGGTIGAETIAPAFLISIVGSLLAGPLIGIIWQHVIGKVEDVPSSIILQFVGAFGVWIGAEVLGLSPILTVVAFAMTVAHYSPARTPARIRVPAYAVWETAVVVLNALAFVMIGVELGSIISNAQPNDLTRWITFSAAIVATVIVVRLVWVVAVNMVLQLATHGQSPTDGGPGWRSGLLVGWCGMRGIVTVAAALALPENFPERDLLLFTAFAVTLSTLVIQGLTLKPLLLALNLRDDGPVEREVRLARIALADAALTTLGETSGAEASAMREEIQVERQAINDAANGNSRPMTPAKLLRSRLLESRRERLLELRRDGTIGDTAFHRLEEELDFADLSVGRRD